MVMLAAMVVAVIAPVLATILAAAAVVRLPQVPLNWIILACASTAFGGQVVVFLIFRWL
jgi:hypothetical protein